MEGGPGGWTSGAGNAASLVERGTAVSVLVAVEGAVFEVVAVLLEIVALLTFIVVLLSTAAVITLCVIVEMVVVLVAATLVRVAFDWIGVLLIVVAVEVLVLLLVPLLVLVDVGGDVDKRGNDVDANLLLLQVWLDVTLFDNSERPTEVKVEVTAVVVMPHDEADADVHAVELLVERAVEVDTSVLNIIITMVLVSAPVVPN